MDCRIIPLCRSEIREYLIERQNEAWRNHVFSYGFYMLQEEGLDPSQAMERMRGMREPGSMRCSSEGDKPGQNLPREGA